MPLMLDDLARLRPFLYHLTARDNLPRIARMRILESASVLAALTGRVDLLEQRRRDHVIATLAGETIVLRDQSRLHRNHMRLDAGWTVERLVRHINDRVFFWPGTEAAPISYGVRHYGRYSREKPAIIRVSLRALVAANPGVNLLVSRYNSGSPRCSGGKPSPRGATTFVVLTDATFKAADVVEVTIPNSVALPMDALVGASPIGPWAGLFDAPRQTA